MTGGTSPILYFLVYRPVPVKPEEEKRWTELYNKRFRSVPAAASCRHTENAFFIYQNDELIGLGQTEGNQILSVASLKPGAGRDCVCSLASLCQGDYVSLLCAEQNHPAMKLYDRLGFSRGRIKEVWFCKKTLAF